MTESIVSSIIGILCIVIGILNMKGNISTLHSYHRHRVSEEDKLPFGKKVGIGSIIIGFGIIINSCLFAISLYVQKQIFASFGMLILFLGLIIGISINLYAIIKYNKGLF